MLLSSPSVLFAYNTMSTGQNVSLRARKILRAKNNSIRIHEQRESGDIKRTARGKGRMRH